MAVNENLFMHHLKNRHDDEGWECEFCKQPFGYDVSSEELLSHLTGVGGSDTVMCGSVPDDVKDDLLQALGIKRRRMTLCSTEGSRVGDNSEEVNMPNVHRTQQHPLLTRELEGKAFEGHKEIIWYWLMDDQVTSIGIYGMGGVGKTTLMTHVQSRLIKEGNPFDRNVYWVTISQDFNIDKLQNAIAEKIDLKFPDHESEKERAARLSLALNDKGKCVLILDDVWNQFDVFRVGVPVSNMCKLILTTRSLEICRQMQCKKIKVEPLSEKEAWTLFAKELGRYNIEVEQLAKEVARECSGLPLGIITIARSMREVNEVDEWKHALKELRKSKVQHGNMDEDVFRVLNWSYMRLNDLALKKCFLYCALFPEDYKIRRDELISVLIAEGIIDEEERREDEFSSGHTINRLDNVCLLEGCIGWDASKSRCVKMHDLIRDMAIQELRSSSTMATLVEAGVQLKELKDVKTWTENPVIISLMNNDLEEIASGHMPGCPNLSTLLLRENRKLKRIANPFFEQFQKLKSC